MKERKRSTQEVFFFSFLSPLVFFVSFVSYSRAQVSCCERKRGGEEGVRSRARAASGRNLLVEFLSLNLNEGGGGGGGGRRWWVG